MKLLEIQFEARLRLGDVADVIGELEAAVATYPFQESLWELLITALYRAGRQADALATYQRVRQQLADELGLDPRPRLQELEQRILVQDPSLDVASRPPARVQASRATGNLPSMTAALVGRDDGGGGSLRPARRRAARGDRRTGWYREDSRRDRGRPQAGLVDRWRLAGQARDRSDGRRRRRRVGQRCRRPGRGRGAGRAVQGHLRGGDPRQLRARLDAAAALAVRLLDAAPGLRILCTSQVPARHRRRGRLRARAVGSRRRGRALHPPRHGPTRDGHGERGQRQRARPVPVPRRSAAGHRAGRRAHQDPVRRRRSPADSRIGSSS